ncbi:hypothetical protein [Streptomyces sp. Tu 3180]|nr:hypothetical protein [Streptomyces sp. Tu 3180]
MSPGAVRVGDEVTVVVAGIDRRRRTVTLTRGRAPSAAESWPGD